MIQDPWVHGTRLGREHLSVRQHLVEDHGVQPGWAESASDGEIHGVHDGRHSRTWSYAEDLVHGHWVRGPVVQVLHGTGYVLR